MNKLSYDLYLDKVYGCFLGKTVYGTLGAPYEGVKMPMNLEFSTSMIDTMKPNDDLDLQILWLEVFEKKGHNFTSKDLLDAFVVNCDYSPGEYAVMRKNHIKGIYPPYSGEFCNDFYREGMGCPIRSEIWACIAACNPSLAADYAKKDGILDHSGDSVYAEQFLAALEAAAFIESDLDKLIDIGLKYIPSDSRIYSLIEYSRTLAKECDDYKKALFLLLKNFGHPDCTNLFQNIGITILSLYFGKDDFIKANMLALNSGFDTDCTCATIGSIMGIIAGASNMIKRYDLDDTRFVLSVRANRRSDSVHDLSEDIAALGVKLSNDKINCELEFDSAPHSNISFDSAPDLVFDYYYTDGLPSIEIGGKQEIMILITNNSTSARNLSFDLKGPNYINIDEMTNSAIINPGSAFKLKLVVSIDIDTKIVYEMNNFTLTVTESGNIITTERFGISCATPWKLFGPYWKTYPSFSTQQIADAGGYWSLFEAMPTSSQQIDLVRGYHINFHLDDEEFVSAERAFAPFDENDYEQEIVNIHEDSFFLDELHEMQGPTVSYLARKLYSNENEDTEVCLQIGYTDPFKLWINGSLISESDRYDFFNSENLHVSGIKLKKGNNDILVRFTKTTPDAKFSMIFSKDLTCAEHFICFGSVNPKFF